MAEANFEGKIVSNFGLGEAGLDLRFKPELLAGKRVLNFGCGGDNYSKEIKNLGIEADIVDVDLVFDASNDLVRPVLKGVKWIAHHIMPHSQFAEKIIGASRKLAGISGRDFVQANGRALPFVDKTFDIVIAHRSTYQVPAEAKPEIFRELMRVGDYVLTGPVTGEDFDIITNVLEDNGYEMIACRPLPNLFTKDDLRVHKMEDYDTFIKTHTEAQRIQRPKRQKPVLRTFPYKDADFPGSSYIVLRRINKD